MLARFLHYEYSERGARWALNISQMPTAALQDASRRNDLCTLPSVMRTKGNASSNCANDLLPAGLCADNGDVGCPHFRCARSDCQRTFDPAICDPRHLSYRIPLLLTGLWWFLFSIPAILTFQRRPTVVVERRAIFAANMRRLWLSVRHIYRLKDTFLFLLCYLLHRNATNAFLLAGIQIMSFLPLALDALEVSGVLVLWTLSGVVGMFFYRWLATVLLRWRQKSQPDVNTSFGCKCVLIINLVILMLMTIWAMPYLGLYTRPEIFIAAALAGLQAGSLFAFSRAFFTRLIPNHFESQFFALYEIVGESMVWPASLIFYAVVYSTTDTRWASLPVFFYLLVSIVALLFVNVKRAQEDSAVFIEQAENEAYGRVQQDEPVEREEAEEKTDA